MSLSTHQEACKIEIQRCYDYATEKYGITIPHIPIIFSNSMSSTAGKVCYKQNWAGDVIITKLVLSNKLLAIQPEAFIKRTPGHEAAHVICTLLYDITVGHGPRWKRIMRELGLEGSRCHSYDTGAAKPNRIAAFCGCSNPHKITKQRVTKMNRGSTYTCKVCKQNLRLNAGPQGPDLLAPLRAVANAAQTGRCVPKPAPSKPSEPVAIKSKLRSKASYIQEAIATFPNLSRDEMVAHCKRKNKQQGWGIKSVRTYVIGNMKKVGR